MKYFICIILILIPLKSFSKNKSELWRFSDRYNFLRKAKFNNQEYLVNIKCLNLADCLALKPKNYYPIKKNTASAIRPEFYYCNQNGGKVDLGSYKNRQQYFCLFSDNTLIELTALRKK